MSVTWTPKPLNKHVAEETVKRLHRAAFMVEADAKRLCPVDTGRLRASISTRVDAKNFIALVGIEHGRAIGKLGAGDARLIADVGPDVHYARWVEMGTVNQAPQPYLRPALEKNKPAIKRLFGA